MKSTSLLLLYRPLIKLALLLGLAAFIPALSGQTTTTWIGTTSDSTAAVNWSNGVPNTGSNLAVFDGSGVTNVNVTTGAAAPYIQRATFSGGSYTFNFTNSTKWGSSGLTIGAGTQTFNGSSMSLAGGTQTWTVAAGANLSVSNNVGSGSTFTLAGAGNITFSGTFSGGSTLNKSGIGTVTLSGSSITHTGNVNVTGGTLLVNGTASSLVGAYTVNAGGTLGGTGTISKATTINTGGTLAPGASPGVLTFGENLTLASGSTTAFELNGLTRGTDYDGINVGGVLSYGGTLGLNFGSVLAGGTTFDLFQLTGTGSVAPETLFSAVTATGSYDGSFTNTDGVWSLFSGGQTLTFTQSTGDLVITGVAAAVPEPATYAAMIGALALSVTLWRRRRQRATD